MSNWSLVCHSTNGKNGFVSVIRGEGDKTRVQTFPLAPASGLDDARKPVFLGVTSDNKILLIDPQTKALRHEDTFPEDAFPAYAYRDTGGERIWFMNDGDKKTGIDTLNCSGSGSSVTVFRNGKAPAEVLKTICVGRGHHVTIFTGPSAAAPKAPRRAFVSNLMDGTICVIGNDPADSANFLNILATINLCEADKEEGGESCIPNSAFPHGMVFSSTTGKLYNLNNGYGTIAVIDPVGNRVETTISLKTSSNLLLSPDGRFLVGKGADRKLDEQHIIGNLSVVDAIKHEVVAHLDLPDIYPSTYRFNGDGSKLYVTSASTGNDEQKANLKKNVVLVFDATALPRLELIQEIEVGLADCGRRPIAFFDGDHGDLVFVPNPTDGTLSIVDGISGALKNTVALTDGPATEVLFSFWDGPIHGC